MIFLGFVCFSVVVSILRLLAPLTVLIVIATIAWMGAVMMANVKKHDERWNRVRDYAARKPMLQWKVPLLVLAPCLFALPMAAVDRTERLQREENARRLVEQHKREASQRAEHEALNAAATAQRHAALRAGADAVVEKSSSSLAQAVALIREAKFEEALGALNAVKADTRPYMELTPVPGNVARVAAEADESYRTAEALQIARSRAQDLPKRLGVAREAKNRRNFVETETLCDQLLQTIKELAPQATVLGLDLEPIRRETEALRTSVAASAKKERREQELIAEKVRRVQEREEAANAQRTAMAEARARRCGPEPHRSAYDGTYDAVEYHLKENANDPGSIDVAECTSAVLTENCWQTACKYRGKNGFGALILKHDVFFLAVGASDAPLGHVIQ